MTCILEEPISLSCPEYSSTLVAFWVSSPTYSFGEGHWLIIIPVKGIPWRFSLPDVKVFFLQQPTDHRPVSSRIIGLIIWIWTWLWSIYVPWFVQELLDCLTSTWPPSWMSSTRSHIQSIWGWWAGQWSGHRWVWPWYLRCHSKAHPACHLECNQRTSGLWSSASALPQASSLPERQHRCC